MLIRNISTQKGLVNGAMGTETSFELTGTTITSIYVLFDDKTIGSTNMNRAYHDPIPIISHTHLFNSRTVFPLILSWATTIHKVQGMSWDKVVVENGMAYIALSRVTALEGLYITELNTTQIIPEYFRLRFTITNIWALKSN